MDKYRCEFHRIIEQEKLTHLELKLYSKISLSEQGFVDTYLTSQSLGCSDRETQKMLKSLELKGLIHFDGIAWQTGKLSQPSLYNQEPDLNWVVV